MVGPSAEKLATMGLLEKKESISTEIVFLRENEKRDGYYTQFKEHNKDVGERQHPDLQWHKM